MGLLFKSFQGVFLIQLKELDVNVFEEMLAKKDSPFQ